MHDVIEIRFESEVLDKKLHMTVLAPEGPPPYTALYLLHGLGGDCQSWLLDFNLPRREDLGRLLIVMPEGDRSYYVNDPRPGGNGLWEDVLLRDVIDRVDRLFPTRKERSGRCIAGLSMGGYGALMLALRHPERFGAAAALSASIYFGHAPHPAGAPRQQTLMDALPEGEYDIFHLAENVPEALRPALSFNCGVEDSHLRMNRAFHQRLLALNYPHDYGEFPGGHTFPYWSSRLPDLFRFIHQAMPGDTSG
jgi:putative tributyrin esterase